jgi:hypothetical protein
MQEKAETWTRLSGAVIDVLKAIEEGGTT